MSYVRTNMKIPKTGDEQADKWYNTCVDIAMDGKVTRFKRLYEEGAKLKDKPWIDAKADLLSQLLLLKAKPVLVDAIFSMGAEVDPLSDRMVTPLLAAIYWGDMGRVEQIVKAGADIHRVSGKEKNFPLGMAAIRGHKEIIKYLLSIGADARMRRSASLVYACKSMKEEVPIIEVASMVDMLLKAGADPDAELPGSRESALIVSLRNGDHASSKLILEAGCRNIRTALWDAFIEPKTEPYSILPTVFSCGISPDALVSVPGKYTLLMHAVNEGSLEEVSYIVSQGAKVNSVCLEGYTALDYAEMGRKQDVALFLSRHGGKRAKEL